MMDFRERLCYDLVWETIKKRLEPSTLHIAYTVDAWKLLKSSPGKTKLHHMRTHFFSPRSTEQINELKQCTGLRLAGVFKDPPSNALQKLNETSPLKS